ncbi:glycosyl transferase family 41 [Xylophilus ampelinus]|uniref:Glycosyl transferase family 41 n=2 Tax=Xylophilus ampelinus TaxID=54067 RepID=A0A318SIF1_9BURK|nr:glycosyl transferase family 41 [Xylophilus ampelinus]
MREAGHEFDRAIAEAQEHERRQELSEALVKYTHALSHDPRHVPSWIRVATILLTGLHWQRGIEALDTALELDPRSVQALYLKAYADFNLGRMEQARASIERAARQSNDSTVWVLRAWILSSLDKDPARTRAVFCDWGRRIADPLTRTAKPLKVLDRDPRRVLRVGYVTADFRRHSVAFFMLPVLQQHRPQEVDVHVFSSGRADDLTPLLQQHVPHWHNVADLADDELCEYIRALRIDVLVDLSGHTLGHRLLTFARRAAPVQVTWLGFMNTLGMKAMDYRLTDYGICPLGSERFYSEKLFRLGCMASYAPPPYAPLRDDPPMLEHGYPTLISLNNSVKVTHEMLLLWTRILEARPDARLIVMVKEQTAEAAQDAMQHRIQAAGMPLDRVFVLHQQPLEQFMELGHIADVALDTAPISGGTTTLHALWMGLPVVALDAVRGIDAASARTLQGLGFGDLVVQGENAYVAKALELMDDAQALRAHRGSCRDKLRSSPLMNYAVRTAELEQAFRCMWVDYLGGTPLSLDVQGGTAATLS